MSLPPAWPRVAGSLWRNLGPARHGRCSRRSPSFISLQLHSPSACPPLGPVWRARCGAFSGRHVMAVVAGVPPVFSLSNFTPFELAPPLGPVWRARFGATSVLPVRHGRCCRRSPKFCLSPTSLPARLPLAWPRVAGSLWRNLGPACHGRCCRRSPSLFSLPLSLPPAWPRVAGSLWRNPGPARHGRCCRRSPSFISLKHLSL